MTTGRPIDHVVLAVEDLGMAAARYEALGFTLTPKAMHDDRMGTSNRLVQFRGRNFLELLEVDRPRALEEHAFEAAPARFSFGAHHRDFLGKRSGISMLVFQSDDVRADVEAFRAAGIRTYAPFEFERQATLPDGSRVTLAFTLGFATNPAMPELAFVVVEDRAPDRFWKPEYQEHANGARSIVAVCLAAGEPEGHGAFLGRLFGGEVEPVDGGVRVRCGPDQEIVVLTPEATRTLAPGFQGHPAAGPLFAGITLSCERARREVTPSGNACGIFIAWRPAISGAATSPAR